jgi:drug/metabolite transporter (DMT)-like permease
MIQSTSSRHRSGIFWMLFAGICFVGVTAIVKHMGTRLPPAESAFLRYLLGLVFLLPMLKDVREAHLTPRQWKLFGMRGLFHSVGVMLWFYSMTRIPIADVTAINYLSPVFVTIGAVIFLRERLAMRRIAAVIIALVGAAIILRPGFREISTGHLAMMVTAVVFAGSYLTAKIMADEVKPTVVVAMLSIFVTIGLAPFAFMTWITPTMNDIGLLFIVACFATAGHYAMTLAFAAAPVTVTQPVTFLQLVWAVLLGALVFGEPVDIWVVFGGLLILASVSFITWREAVLNRRPITPTTNSTKV